MDENSAYRRAGVDLDAAEQSLTSIEEAVKSTYDDNVIAGLGAFGGLYALTDLPERPVLVASTDGVGTKTKVATATGRLEHLGEDLVNHCINDILVQGAKPLFFLDYIASSRLRPEQVEAVVSSAASACRAAGIPLLGGETAEMPGVYEEGELDLVGTIVGLVARDRLVDGSSLEQGDVILALASHGLHTNGFSLARAVLTGSFGEKLGESTVGEELLRPHRSYLLAVAPLLEKPGLIKGMVHVTGGGIPGNLPRVLPAGLGAEVEMGSWPVPAIFGLIAERGEVTPREMHRVFNMGAGYLLIVSAEDEERLRDAIGEEIWTIGRVTDGPGVRLV